MAKKTLPVQVTIKELKLGDIIALDFGGGPWNHAIVKKITETDVILFRPYGTSADFSYTGGVICYVGMEEIPYSLSENYSFSVVERKELK